MSAFMRVTNAKKKDLCISYLCKAFYFGLFFFFFFAYQAHFFFLTLCLNSHTIERERGAHFSSFKRMCFPSIYWWMFQITSKSFSKWNKKKWLMYQNCAAHVHMKCKRWLCDLIFIYLIFFLGTKKSLKWFFSF